MADVFRFPDPPPKPAPKSIFRATFLIATGPSSKPLTCAAYDTEYGLELRLSYSDDDVMRSQLFRGPLQEDDCAEMADRWRMALVQKGFTVSDE